MSRISKTPVGRPSLVSRDDDKDKVVLIAIKIQKSLENKILDKVKELKGRGIKTNKSELIRFLAEYSLDWAEDIYRERGNEK